MNSDPTTRLSWMTPRLTITRCTSMNAIAQALRPAYRFLMSKWQRSHEDEITKLAREMHAMLPAQDITMDDLWGIGDQVVGPLCVESPVPGQEWLHQHIAATLSELTKLSPRHTAVILLMKRDKVSAEECALRLGISVTDVYRILTQAKTYIRIKANET